jgi:nitrate reductase gamma subunit
MATESTATTVARERAGGIGTAVYTDGMLAGVVGGLAIALWFLVIDAWNGRPFYTPTMLGAAVFQAGTGPVDPASIRPSLEIVLPFTWLHLLVFATIGVVASRLLAIAERNANYGFGVLLFFVVFEIGFLAASLAFAEQVLHAIAWPAVLIGNLIAAAAMAAVLWRRHPDLRVLP